MLYAKSKIAIVATLSALANASASRVEVRANAASGGDSLSADAIQSGSASSGVGAIGSETGQAASLTSTDNFIDFCAGKTLTNGLQFLDGSCNGIVMGDIPAKSTMISSLVLFPGNGGSVASDTTFNISVQVNNLVAGFFTDADTTYYAAPQQLQGGKVVGHTHVTVQDTGNTLNPTSPLDPTLFSFFKGINDAGNGEGLLQAEVTGGLPGGTYRVCTLTSAANHQPVIMPVAQRGSQDDCKYFTVTGSGSTINVAANDGSKGIAAAAAASEAIVGATNSAFAASVIAAESAAAVAATATTAASVATTTASKAGKGGKAASVATTATSVATTKATKATGTAAAGKSTTGKTGAGAAKGGFGGKGRGRGRKQRFAKREFIA